jgi:DNA-binding transcriptional LysR family regulator
VDIETSPVLLDRLAQGKLDILVARLFAEHDKSQLRYEALVEEPISAVVRPSHPLLGMSGVGLRDLVSSGWIVPPSGSVLRHRFDLMFQEEGLAPPINLIETSALLFMTRMLQQSDMVGIIANDVARYYAAHGIVTILPVAMNCHMDNFGIITRTDRLLSPAAQVMMRSLKAVCQEVYGKRLDSA